MHPINLRCSPAAGPHTAIQPENWEANLTAPGTRWRLVYTVCECTVARAAALMGVRVRARSCVFVRVRVRASVRCGTVTNRKWAAKASSWPPSSLAS